jgi:predicted nucleotidyltransferase
VHNKEKIEMLKEAKKMIRKNDALKNVSSEKLITDLQKEFEFIKYEVMGILLYGSFAKETADSRSDIDICLIKPADQGKLTKIFKKTGGKYDVKIFEDLPLYVKMGIIENYKIIYGDEPRISYYLYGFRKNWNDMRYRIMSNKFRSLSDMELTRRKWRERRR